MFRMAPHHFTLSVSFVKIEVIDFSISFFPMYFFENHICEEKVNIRYFAKSFWCFEGVIYKYQCLYQIG
jgi:hypothetical protein